MNVQYPITNGQFPNVVCRSAGEFGNWKLVIGNWIFIMRPKHGEDLKDKLRIYDFGLKMAEDTFY